MVTNVPFYSFKDISFKRSVPFIVIVAIALGIAVVNIAPPLVLFAAFCVYGTSGYADLRLQALKGKPVSVIATSMDEPDEEGLASLTEARVRVARHDVPNRDRAALLLLGDQRAR